MIDIRDSTGNKSDYRFLSLLRHARRMFMSSEIKLLRIGAIIGFLRRCLKSLMLGNPSYHQVSHGDVNHRLAALREELIILVQSPVFVQPTECPLHPPPFGQNHQPFHVVGGLDNLETNLARASKLPHPSDEWPRLGAIGPNTAQAGQLMTQKSQ